MFAPVIVRVRERLGSENRNWMALIIGETGSGKSYTAMSLAQEIDPSFPEDARRVYFSVTQLVNDIRDNKVTKGMVVILDETGVTFSNRKWWSQENRNFGFLLQAIRHRCFAIIFCLPSMSMMDKQGRQLAHALIQTERINYREKYVLVRWKEVSWNDFENRLFYRFPRVVDHFGVIRKQKQMRVYLPTKALIEAYEIKKREFTDKLTDDSSNAVNGIKKTTTSVDKVDRRKERINESENEAFKLFENGLSQTDVAIKMNKSLNTVSKYMTLYKAKKKVEL
jgi:ABC-type dipeptide/oligopeptide/nickel transport system ATPase component